MKIIFRSSAAADIKWFRQYYSIVFPAGDENAKKHYRNMCSALLTHPFIGHAIDPNLPARELPIPRTPFSFIYYIKDEEIIVLRVLDNRAERPAIFPI